MTNAEPRRAERKSRLFFSAGKRKAVLNVADKVDSITLEIEATTQKADKGIDKTIESLKAMKTALNGINTKKLRQEMESFEDFQKKLQTAFSNIKVSGNPEELRKQIYLTYDIKQLMGVEGNIRKLYYSAWPIIINQKIELDKRVKRPPDNLINTLISFMNSIIYTKTLSEIYKTQLNPTISYLHEPSDKRFSLCLDVSEVFKPLIVDRTIFSLLNKNMITENDFYTDDGGYYRMKESSIKKVMKALEETLSRSIKHKDLNRDVSYKHLIRLELYKLIKHIINEKNYEGFKIWW